MLENKTKVECADMDNRFSNQKMWGVYIIHAVYDVYMYV